MDVGDGNPGLGAKDSNRIFSLVGDSHYNGGLRGANREWMLIMEIRFWAKGSNMNSIRHTIPCDFVSAEIVSEM